MSRGTTNWAKIIGVTLMCLLFQFNSCDNVRFTSPKEDIGKQGEPPVKTCVPTSTTVCVPCADGKMCNAQKYTDTKTIAAQVPKKDYFLVIDNSGSMADDNKELGNRLSGFVSLLNSAQIDWQMCYTSTDDSNGNSLLWKRKNGANVVNTNFKVLKPSRAVDDATLNIDEVFRTSVGGFIGNGTGNEEGIKIMGRTVNNGNNSDCFRADANLVYLVISDEDEASCGGRCKDAGDENVFPGRQLSAYTGQYKELTAENMPDSLVNTVKNKFGDKSLTVHSLVIRSLPQKDINCYNLQDSSNVAFYGKTYESLTKKTAGVVGNICSANYSTELTDIFNRDKEILASVSLRCAPIGPAPVVKIVPLAQGQSHRVEGNKVIFDPALAEGSSVTVTYYCEAPK